MLNKQSIQSNRTKEQVSDEIRDGKQSDQVGRGGQEAELASQRDVGGV